MKLSVIIPVYRVEQTLVPCVESVVGQDYGDMEVILVDDGSPDRCPQLCETLARKYPAVSVVHRSNGGLSAARNTGLSAARGEYVTFIDSDDWLEPHTYAPLMDLLSRHPDIDLLEYSADIKGEELLRLEDKVYHNARDYWTQAQAFRHTYAWNKIYRATLFNGVAFPEDKVFEDVWTLPLILQRARRVATTPQGLYHYRRNTQGITANATGAELASLLEAHLATPLPTPLIHLINIQLDVYRLGRRILLPDGLPAERGKNVAEKIKLFIYKQLGIKNLCIIHKTFRSH